MFIVSFFVGVILTLNDSERSFWGAVRRRVDDDSFEASWITCWPNFCDFEISFDDLPLF